MKELNKPQLVYGDQASDKLFPYTSPTASSQSPDPCIHILLVFLNKSNTFKTNITEFSNLVYYLYIVQTSYVKHLDYNKRLSASIKTL